MQPRLLKDVACVESIDNAKRKHCSAISKSPIPCKLITRIIYKYSKITRVILDGNIKYIYLIHPSL